ncbi:MAG: hypothetical protein WCT13_02390 [Patescibacteria group bacterium]|jgi:hypothetical protein
MRDDILEMNERMSALFMETTQKRRAHRRKHPTEWAVTKCMDGRVNLRRCSGIPFGLTSPFRNIGGRFSAGWPKFRDSMLEFYRYAHSQHVPAGLLITYHYSESDDHLGCAGFENNLDHSKEYLSGFLAEVKEAFPKMIWPFLLGIETGSDALILHLEDGSTIDMRKVTDPTEGYFKRLLLQRCRSYPRKVLRDIIPFLTGNHEHLAGMKAEGEHPTTTMCHNERGIALGQGFDWIDRDNFLLILGPCDPDLGDAIVRAAKIVENNLDDEARSKGGILLVSTPYRGRMKWERPSAVTQSRYLTRLALDHIQNQLPSMADYFVPLVGVLDQDTRRFEEIK